MIQPVPARLVHFFLANLRPGFAGVPTVPLAAVVCQVNTERNVNLCVFDAVGRPFAFENIPLVQEGDSLPAGDYCRWMAFQTGQAAASDSLKEQVSGAIERMDRLTEQFTRFVALANERFVLAESVIADMHGTLGQRAFDAPFVPQMAGASDEATQGSNGAPAPSADAQQTFENAPKEAQTISGSDVGDVSSVLGAPVEPPAAP